MAYEIDQQGQKWCVVKDDPAKTVMDCHTTYDAARLHLAALYQGEPAAEVEDLVRDAFTSAAEKHQLRW